MAKRLSLRARLDKIDGNIRTLAKKVREEKRDQRIWRDSIRRHEALLGIQQWIGAYSTRPLEQTDYRYIFDMIGEIVARGLRADD